MKKIILIFLISISFIPLVSLAQTSNPPKLDYSGLVQCDGVVSKDAKGKILPGEEERNRECDFNYLLQTIKYLINWLFLITIPFATVMVAYGGLLYLSGAQDKISRAKKIFSSIATGFIIMLVAWFAVITVVNWFISQNNKKIINTFVNTSK